MWPSSPHEQEPRKNLLLASLPQVEFERSCAPLEPVSLKLGQVLYESGDKMDHVYFPSTSIISLLYEMENGSTAEIGVVDHDGVLGIALFMGGDTTPNRAVVQSAGTALRMNTASLMQEFSLGGDFHNILLRYTQALLTQISQTGRVQSPSFRRTAAVPMAAAESRSHRIRHACHDA